MGFDGIIFDFNGVLWWDGHLQEHAWRRFSREKRGVPFSEEEMAVHVHGRNNRHTLEYLLGRALSPEELDQLVEHKESLYRRLCLDQGAAFQLSPGAVELLDFLVDRRIPHTIATASGKDNLEFYVRHLDLARWFEVEKIVYDDGSRPGKPAPDIYLQAARHLELAPAGCIVVEDSRSGIQAAHAAGAGRVIALGPPGLAGIDGVDEVVESLGCIDRARLFPPSGDAQPARGGSGYDSRHTGRTSPGSGPG